MRKEERRRHRKRETMSNKEVGLTGTKEHVATYGQGTIYLQ